MTQEKKSLGFFAVFSTMVGMVIGIGVFAKNRSIFLESEGNIGIAIAGWLVIGVVATLMIIAFMEIASLTRKKGSGGLAAWANALIGKKTGTLISATLTYFIFPGLVVVLCWFSVQFFLSGALEHIKDPLFQLDLRAILQPILSLIVVGSVTTAIMLKRTYGVRIQKVTTLLKIVPLLMIVFAGFIVPFLSGNKPGLTNPDHWQTEIDGKPKGAGDYILSFILTLPPIMFAFDSFIYGANLQQEVKTKKTFIIGIFSGMMFIVAFYTIYALSVFNLGNSKPKPGQSLNQLAESFRAKNLFIQIFDNPIAGTLMMIIVAVSAYGSVNGMFLSGTRLHVNMAKDQIYNDKKNTIVEFNQHSVPVRAGRKMISLVVVWFLILVIMESINFAINRVAIKKPNPGLSWNFKPATNLGYGDIIDKIGDAMTLFGFIIYAIVMFGGLMNRKKPKVKVDKLKGFVPASIISLILLTLIIVINFLNYFGFIQYISGKGTKFMDGLPVQLIILIGVIISGISYKFLLYTNQNKDFDFNDWFNDKFKMPQKIRNIFK